MKEQENEKRTGAGLRSTLKKRLSAKRIALMGVFVALSYAVSWLEIPLNFGVPFLKLDLGNVFIVLIAFLLGPVEGVIVCLLKESLRLIGGTGAGELANFITTSSYLLLPSILYQYKKNLKTVIISLLASCLIATGVALLANRFVTFPFFASLDPSGLILGYTVAEAFAKWWWGVLLFNLTKTLLVGIATILLYKRLSNFLKKMKI